MDVLRHRSPSPPWRHEPRPHRPSITDDNGNHHSNGISNSSSNNNHDAPTAKAGFAAHAGLPAIPFLDMDKVKREAAAVAEYDAAAAVSTSTPVNLLAPSLVSPSAACTGPPPPYSFASAPAASAGQAWSGYISPSASAPHRSPIDGKDSSGNASTTSQTTTENTAMTTNTAPPRHSLPSIHEALGKDTALLYSSSAAPPSHHHHSTAPPLQSLLSGPPNPFATSHIPPLLPPAYGGSGDANDARPPPTSSAYRPPLANGSATTNDDRIVRPLDSSTHPATPTSPTTGHHSSPHASAASSSGLHNGYLHTSPFAPPSSALPAPHPSSSYASYQHRSAYSYPPLTNGAAAAAAASASTTSGSALGAYGSAATTMTHSWRGDGAEMHRAEEMRRAAAKRSPVVGGQHYGESVKRHLEIFDLETSLNEIAEGGERAANFARHFCALSHRTQRSGPQPGSFPTLNECDDMIQRQQQLVDSLIRLRDVIVTQQTALAKQQSRDESSRAQLHHAAYATASGAGAGAGASADDSSVYGDKADGAGGFAGADTKKRRGRNAPPGRCHSCNRAETPEWRRGPDGARTLCNACGLHYAKLTRKMGNKAGSINSSNLRPKDSVTGSP